MTIPEMEKAPSSINVVAKGVKISTVFKATCGQCGQVQTASRKATKEGPPGWPWDMRYGECLNCNYDVFYYGVKEDDNT